MGWAVVFFWLVQARAQDDYSTQTKPDAARFARYAEKVFLGAKTRFETEPNNPDAAWRFGRACYDWAEFATSDRQRADIAKQGIAACRKLIGLNTGSVQGHYFLAMNLGQMARTQLLGGLKTAGQMESEFKIVLSLDPAFDFGGADRGLGLLYFEAPGWSSLGSKTKARVHLQKALKLSPDFPENLLNLIEAELKWGDKPEALQHLTELDELWPTARKKFAGEEWGSSWVIWERRREAAERKASKIHKAPDLSR